MKRVGLCLVLLAACTIPSVPECKTLQCFVLAYDNCEQAQFSFTEMPQGAIHGSKTTWIIEGLRGNRCSIFSREKRPDGTKNEIRCTGIGYEGLGTPESPQYFVLAGCTPGPNTGYRLRMGFFR